MRYDPHRSPIINLDIKDIIMGSYMLQASYTPEAWTRLVKKPQNRLDVIRSVVEKLGGTIEGSWLSFGEHDIVLICKLPNTISAAAFSIAASAGGALKSAKTTPLLSFEEGLEAMKQAGKSGYRPPE
jgi:uncharacterized protein with GYD domain